MLGFMGYLLIIPGVGVGGYCSLAGLSFSAGYLMGFIGTAGRKAGGELATMLMQTFGLIFVSWLLVKLGMKLNAIPRHKPGYTTGSSDSAGIGA